MVGLLLREIDDFLILPVGGVVISGSIVAVATYFIVKSAETYIGMMESNISVFIEGLKQ